MLFVLRSIKTQIHCVCVCVYVVGVEFINVKVSVIHIYHCVTQLKNNVIYIML